MKLTAIALFAAGTLSCAAQAADIDSVFKVVDSAAALMNAGAKMLENGVVIGKVESVVDVGNVTQVQTGGKDNTQEMNVGSVVGGKVIGVFNTKVTTGDLTQLQSGSNNRQILNLGVVR